MAKYENITVQLIGLDGNAFSILGRVMDAMKKSNVSQSEIDVFLKEATSSDYDNLLTTVAKWVDVS
jgi:hypothetical protein